MGTAKGDGYTVTPRDLELIVNAINCTRLPFELDYPLLAHRLSYKNAQSAKAAWNALKKKLDRVAEGAAVVPSLTIEPEPLRRADGEGGVVGVSHGGRKRGKMPIGEEGEEDEESSESGNASEGEGMEGQRGKGKEKEKAGKLKKRKIQAYARGGADVDGDVAMGTTGGETPLAPMGKSKKPTSSQHKPKPKRRHPEQDRARIPTTSASASASPANSDATDHPPHAPQTPARKKLKRTFEQLAVQDRTAGGPKAGRSSAKAREAFWGGRADEDDEEMAPPPSPPPPAYVKREEEGGGQGGGVGGWAGGGGR